MRILWWKLRWRMGWVNQHDLEYVHNSILLDNPEFRDAYNEVLRTCGFPEAQVR